MNPEPIEGLGDLMPPGRVASRAQILGLVSRRTLDHLLRAGSLVRLGHGRYRLADSATPVGARSWARWGDGPSAGEVAAIAADLALARAHGGILVGTSAARALGWMLLDEPAIPTIVIPRERRPPKHPRGKVRLLRRDLPDGSLLDGTTTPLETLLTCTSALTFEAALAVADSAVRSGAVERHEFCEAAACDHRAGIGQARRVASLVDPRSANPFESAVRALAVDVPGLDLEPQVTVRAASLDHRVDLCDRSLRLIIEADSFAFHGGKDDFVADIARYNRLVAAGWTVIRVSWDLLCHRRAELLDTLHRVVDLAIDRRTNSLSSAFHGTPPARGSERTGRIDTHQLCHGHRLA